MSFVAVAIGGSALIGGATSLIAGGKAAGAARDAASAQSATDRYVFDTAREDNAPWRSVGTGALGKLAQMYGIKVDTNNGSFGASPDYAAYVRANPDLMADSAKHSEFGGDLGAYGQWHYNTYGANEPWRGALPTKGGVTMPSESSDPYGGFTASPGYQFRMDQGLKAIERSAAARGGLRSGATMKSLNDYAQGTASDEYARYTGNLFQLAGFGQQANQANQQAGAQFAANQGQTNAQMGAARASAYANTGNAINNTVGNLAGMYLYTQGYGKR